MDIFVVLSQYYLVVGHLARTDIPQSQDQLVSADGSGYNRAAGLMSWDHCYCLFVVKGIDSGGGDGDIAEVKGVVKQECCASVAVRKGGGQQ